MYRVALVCEGPTDRVILEAVLDTYLDDYVPLAIQPPSSATGRLGTGWKGVRAWCAQEASVGGGGALGVLPRNADLIVVQVDADVAKEHDSGIVLDDGAGCPPPSVLTDPVRAALLTWLGVSRPPGGLVLCVPAMATETWALVALYPESIASDRCIECETSIKVQLRKLASKREPKLVTLQDGKPKNNASGYRVARHEIAEGWSTVLSSCSEAARFDQELQRWLAARSFSRQGILDGDASSTAVGVSRGLRRERVRGRDRRLRRRRHSRLRLRLRR